MGQITVSRRDNLTVLTIQLPDGTTATIELPQETAQHLGSALIAYEEQDLAAGSLFEVSPMLVTWNPPIELRRSDKGQILIAYQPKHLRPIIVQLDHDDARDLLATLTDFLGK